ncbi:2-oxoglutaramate amidase [bacterium BMS3Abin03]|nr:2-oxoglutaramate amidase [bacterium BMS3Abin03]
MRLGLVQYCPVWEDKKANKEKILSLLKDESNDFDLLIFPEMTLTGFTMRSNKFAEKLKGESYKFFKSIARDFNVNVIAGIIEKPKKKKIYNTLIHVSPRGKLVGSYRKIHPFSYSNEDKHYNKGSRQVITKINDWKIGLSICYDLRFPELYRYYAKKKVHLIINIANWPHTRIDHWHTLLKARAIENQCYFAGVNRVGDSPKQHYNGMSGIFDPLGRTVEIVENEERVIYAEIEKSEVDDVRKKLPFLDDIRLI